MTGSKMAKAALVEQQRLSGAITSAITESIMTNVELKHQAKGA